MTSSAGFSPRFPFNAPKVLKHVSKHNLKKKNLRFIHKLKLVVFSTKF